MKKLILTAIIAMVSTIGHAQILRGHDVFEANNTLEVGLHSGVVGRRQDAKLDALGFSASIYGAYIDYICWWRDKKTFIKTHLGEDRTECFHVGYQFPITSWLKVTPLIGYASVEVMGREILSWDNPYRRMYTQIIPGKKSSGFDFGGQIQVCIPVGDMVNLNVSGTFTKYCEYCGIGVGIKL